MEPEKVIGQGQFRVVVTEPFTLPPNKLLTCQPKPDAPPINYDQFFKDEAFVKAALENGAQPNRTNWLGQPALHEACATGHLGIVQQLLLFGADPNKAGVERQTALHVAAQAGHFMVCSALLNCGADCNVQGSGTGYSFANEVDRNGNTALHEAARKSRAGIIALIFSQGNAKILKNKQNQFPIDCSPIQGDTRKLLAGEIKDFHEYSGLAFAQADQEELIVIDDGASGDDSQDADYEPGGVEEIESGSDETDGEGESSEGGMDVI